MTQALSTFDASPLLAILRGVSPTEIEAVADVLVDTGIRAIEIPLNSPDPYLSIEILAKKYGASILLGAGTVLCPADVQQVANAGGKIIVSPNLNESVVAKTLELDLISVPGVFTPSEAFTAIELGAQMLKYFPAELSGPAAIKAWRAVLPKQTAIVATGGVTPKTLASWMSVGCQAVGLGSALYKSGMTTSNVGNNAKEFVSAYRRYLDAKA